MNDSIERATRHAEQMYPEATVRVRNIRGRPVLLALEDNVIRIIKYEFIEERTA